MKCTVHIDKTREEEVVIWAKSRSPLIEDILSLLEEHRPLLGFREDSITPLSWEEVSCFTIVAQKMFAKTEAGDFRLKCRLWELESRLPPTYVKINQSTLANIKQISRFTISPTGSLMVHFRCGYRDYVSRRQLKAVKEKLGI